MMDKQATLLCRGSCGLHYTSDKLLDGKCIICVSAGLKGEIEELQETVDDLNESIKDLCSTVEMKDCPRGLTVRVQDRAFFITGDSDGGLRVTAVARATRLQLLVVYPESGNIIRMAMKDI